MTSRRSLERVHLDNLGVAGRFNPRVASDIGYDLTPEGLETAVKSAETHDTAIPGELVTVDQPLEKPLPTHLQAARAILRGVKTEDLPHSGPEQPLYGLPKSKDRIERRRTGLQNKADGNQSSKE